MKDKKKAAEDLFYRIGYGRESRVERPRNRAVDRSLRRMIGKWNEHSNAAEGLDGSLPEGWPVGDSLWE